MYFESKNQINSSTKALQLKTILFKYRIGTLQRSHLPVRHSFLLQQSLQTSASHRSKACRAKRAKAKDFNRSFFQSADENVQTANEWRTFSGS